MVMNDVFLWGLLLLIPCLLLLVWLLKRRKHAQMLAESLYEQSVDETQIMAETNSTPSPQVAEEKPEPADDLIIHLVIKALDDKRFSGTDIMLLMDDLSLEYGEMQLFHHYGLDENPQQKPVFSVANMLEPGTFDVNNMLNFSTSGLIVFMRLPNLLDGRVAFELMLNHAQSIAQHLHGQLENAQGQVLETPQVALLRDQISQYEHKNADI